VIDAARQSRFRRVARCSILSEQFAVDDQEGVRNPIGMAGVRLEARIHIVTAAQTYSQNLSKCCERAGVTPGELMFEPLASADAACFPRNASSASRSSISAEALRRDRFLQWCRDAHCSAAIGGNHLTADVARASARRSAMPNGSRSVTALPPTWWWDATRSAVPASAGASRA